MIENAGFTVKSEVVNERYPFLTHGEVMEKYGVKSISLLAVKGKE